jgi:esterase
MRPALVPLTRFTRSIHSSSSSSTPLSLSSFPFSSSSSFSSPHPLIFLHGLLGNALNWRSVGQQFSSHQAIGLDLRNHGNSPHHSSNDYISQSLDLVSSFTRFSSPVHLVGHSMGAKVAMTIALTRPELIASLTLVDMSPYDYSPSSSSWSSVGRVLEALRGVDFSRIQTREEVAEQLKLSINDPILRGFLLQNVKQINVHNDVKYGWRINLPVLYEFLHSGQAAKFPFERKTNKSEQKAFRGPTLFIGGTLSDYIQPEYYPCMNDFFPGHRLVMIEGADHWVHFSKPKQLVNELRNFIQIVENKA